MKQFLKRHFPGLRQAKRRAQAWWSWAATLAYHWDDLRISVRHMHWRPRETRYWPLSAELLFQFHKLEKGMCMPGTPRFFGEAPVHDTARLVRDWRDGGHAAADSVCAGAVATLASYRERVAPLAGSAASAQSALRAAEAVCREYAADAQFHTPMPLPPVPAQAWPVFQQLVQARRSVRQFKPTAVDVERLSAAVQAAQWSPSACNRQPWRVHVYRQRGQIDALLKLQNGNRGFGHGVPALLILTVDASGFFDASERHQPYIDGGLFTMSLLYALQAQGLASCCLNWCVSPATDRRGHALAGIPEQERILMYLAVGEPAEGCVVPRSPRRGTGTVLHLH